MTDGLYAKINTNNGAILIELTYEKTPGTVGNFVCLSEGIMKNKHQSIEKPYYNGLTFHRVIEDFMIQGGCPNGDGRGGPGYQFNDEFYHDLKHDKAGVLSMANSGSNTNGSQFFITHTATDWLDNKHTVFGFVKEGQDIVNSVAQGDTIKNIEIIRVGEDAKNWDALIAFKTFNENSKKREEEAKLKESQVLEKITQGFNKTEEGIYYKIVTKGNGKAPKKGDEISVHYTGMLIDGRVFDSSVKRSSPISFTLGQGEVIRGWDIGMSLLNMGSKAVLVIPSNLAYGETGAEGVIPPDSTLIFEVELLSIA